MSSIMLGILFYIARFVGCVFLVRTGAMVQREYRISGTNEKRLLFRLLANVAIGYLLVSSGSIYLQFFWSSL